MTKKIGNMLERMQPSWREHCISYRDLCQTIKSSSHRHLFFHQLHDEVSAAEMFLSAKLAAARDALSVLEDHIANVVSFFKHVIFDPTPDI